jgi:hypothetical protein
VTSVSTSLVFPIKFSNYVTRVVLTCWACLSSVSVRITVFAEDGAKMYLAFLVM